jgi:cold-inducible RNA-binding protein
MGTRLFVGNLSYNVNEQELKEAFQNEQIEVRSVRIAMDRDTGRPRGFAFVETETEAGAKEAIEKLAGRLLAGRAIIIEEAQARPGPGGPPGGFENRDRAKGDSRRERPEKKRSTRPKPEERERGNWHWSGILDDD